MFYWLFILLCVVILIVFVVLGRLNSFYLDWNYIDFEIVVFGVVFYVFEWLFVRLVLIVFIGVIIGIFLICKKI